MKLLFLALGLILLGLILREIDLADLFSRASQVGLLGIALIVLLYSVTFLTDVIGWLLTLYHVRFDTRWVARLYLVRMVGEAFNNVTPSASVGGEPIKALLLKSHYGIGYRESTASLVLAKTTNLFGLIAFLIIGFGLLMVSEFAQPSHKLVAGCGLVVLVVLTAAFFLFQRLRVSSIAGSRLGGTRFGARLTGIVQVIRDVDEQFLAFYTGHRRRLIGSIALAFLNWLFGVLELYLVMHFLGYPITILEAWTIEAMVQLVRAGTFFIPAGIGTQEAVLAVFGTAVTGDPVAGLAFALIRRGRELLWILLGLLLWWWYSSA